MRCAARSSFTRATERYCVESSAGYLGSTGIRRGKAPVAPPQRPPRLKKTLFGPYIRLDHVNIVPGHCMKRRHGPRGILFLIRFTYSGSFIFFVPPNQIPPLYMLHFSGTSKPTIALRDQFTFEPPLSPIQLLNPVNAKRLRHTALFVLRFPTPLFT